MSKSFIEKSSSFIIYFYARIISHVVLTHPRKLFHGSKVYQTIIETAKKVLIALK